MKVCLFVSFLVFLLHLFAYLIHLFVCCIDHVVVIQSCAVFCFGSSQKAKLKWHMIHNCQSWEGSIWKPNKGIIMDIFCRWWMVDLLIHVASFLCQRISNKLPRTPWEGSSPTDNSSHNSGMICALCRCFSYFSYSDILYFFTTEALCSRLVLVCASLELLMTPVWVCSQVDSLLCSRVSQSELNQH